MRVPGACGDAGPVRVRPDSFPHRPPFFLQTIRATKRPADECFHQPVGRSERVPHKRHAAAVSRAVRWSPPKKHVTPEPIQSAVVWPPCLPAR